MKASLENDGDLKITEDLGKFWTNEVTNPNEEVLVHSHPVTCATKYKLKNLFLTLDSTTWMWILNPSFQVK